MPPRPLVRQTGGVTVTPPPSTTTRDVGVGVGGLATSDMVLNIGPQHPATHGVLRLKIVLDGERIVSDSFSTVYGNASNEIKAIRDYFLSLTEYFEILEEAAAHSKPSRDAFRRLRSTIQRA